MKKCAILVVLLIAEIAAAAEWVVSAEGDNRHTYTFISRVTRKPVARGREIDFAGTLSYLRYDSGGERVNSPGLGASAMYRLFGPRFSVGAGGGYEVRYTMRSFSGEPSRHTIEQGPIALTDATFRVAEQTWIAGNVAYSTANHWTNAHAQLKQGLSPTLRIGPELAWAGNRDIRVREQGGILEIRTGGEHTWMQLRAGTATIRDRTRTEERRPYFSIGVARSF